MAVLPPILDGAQNAVSVIFLRAILTSTWVLQVYGLCPKVHYCRFGVGGHILFHFPSVAIHIVCKAVKRSWAFVLGPNVLSLRYV